MANVPRMSAEESGCASALRASPLPNFRRFMRKYSNASDASKEDPVIRRFFMVLRSGFNKEVKLPSKFCRELGKNVPRDAILISYQGMWKINFGRCRCHMDLVLSGDGWRSFVQHHDLEEDNLVWFEQTDSMVFRIHAFDVHAKGEKFSPGNWQAERAHVGLLDHTGCNYGGLHRSNFTLDIEEHHLRKPYLTIPAEFVKRNEELKKKEVAILVNSCGHAWEVELCLVYDSRFPPQSQRHITLRRGWPAFRESIKFQIRDVCTFTLDHYSTLASPDSVVMSICILRTI